MKKIVILVTSLLLVFTLSGCDEFGAYGLEETEILVDDVIVEDIIIEEIIVEEELLEDPVIEEDIITEEYVYTELWGSVTALSAESLTLEDMLTYAIEDEYSAYAEYIYILDNFEVTNPFSNIINAELSHIDMLLPLFGTYEIEVPYNDAENHLLPVIDLEDTFRTGVIAEILNIDMYNLFLEYDLPEDIRDTFIALRDASMKHLEAFEKNLAKYE